jgi:putative ABC transport system substrate-binding protein
MNPKLFWLITAILFVFIPTAEAQQQAKVPRIGYVSGGGDPNTLTRGIERFRQGLRDLGYVEGKNVTIEYRYAEGKIDLFPGLIAELVRLKVDVIVSPVTTAIRAAKQATKTIPIVMVITSDPVASGLVDNLAHLGGYITGVTRLTRNLSGKRLELLRDAIPSVTRVGVLWDVNGEGPKISIKEYETTAPTLKIELHPIGVRGPNPDLKSAFELAAKSRVHALITIHNSLIVRYPKQLADQAINSRLPSMYEESQYAEAGGLMSYSSNNADQYKRAAVYVDKILKGARPSDLPIEQPTKFEFVINLKTAKQIGLTIPPNVLARADRVIR